MQAKMATKMAFCQVGQKWSVFISIGDRTDWLGDSNRGLNVVGVNRGILSTMAILHSLSRRGQDKR